MPFIEKQDRTEREELKLKIRPEVIALVKAYAQFLESEEWFVVQEVLRKAIEGDKEFQYARKSMAQLPAEGKKEKSVS
ncbi:MAG TPA: hypothetical protein VFD98_08645 [Terracidiphilus sp.]|jgi:hypothetical protein|nr:hypothetical protein [Terracidiphilus sp.]